MTAKILKRLDDHIRNLETRNYSPASWILGLIAIILVRNILEGFLEEKHIIGLHETITISLIDFFLQNTLFFIALFLTLSILFHLLGKTPIQDVVRPLTYYYAIIIVVPFIDFLVSRGQGFYLGYPVTSESAWQIIVHFFNPFFTLEGISVGLRIEVFTACVFGALYVYRKSFSLVRAVLTPITIYLAVLFHGFFPFLSGVIIKLIFQLPGDFSTLEETFKDIFLTGESLPYSGLRFSLLWLFWISYLVLLWFYRFDKRALSHWLRRIWSGGILHYPVVVSFGLLIGYIILRVPAQHILANPFGVISVFTVLLLSFLTGIVIDTLGIHFQQERAVESRQASSLPYQQFIVVFLFSLSLLLMLLIDVTVLILLFSIYSLAYLLYRAPFFLASYYLVSVLLLTGIDMLLIFQGVFLFGGVRTPMIISPVIIAVMILASFSLSLFLQATSYPEADSVTRKSVIGTGRGKSILLVSVLLLWGLIAILLSDSLLFFTSLFFFVVLAGGWFLLSKAIVVNRLVFYSFWALITIFLAQKPDLWENYGQQILRHEKLSAARKAFEDGRYYQAIEHYNQMLEMEDNISQTSIFLELGISYLKIENYHAAAEVFEKYLNQNPFSKDALMGKAIALEKLGHLENSLDIYVSLLQRGFSEPRIVLMYGMTLFEAGRYAEALLQYDKIDYMKGSIPYICIYRGDVLLKLKKYELARDSYRETFNLSTDSKIRRLAQFRLDMLPKLEKSGSQ
ncbi:tetratricopeptide repeat protein [candidate division CSSED10-310 bacterium]|uniref:Tetratricopeptide repeat protein n=1 Tax=candidate division CSSED10-310 bacterium TaxID=2855610 RepID=A0ABV6Z347_UNCC1